MLNIQQCNSELTNIKTTNTLFLYNYNKLCVKTNSDNYSTFIIN